MDANVLGLYFLLLGTSGLVNAIYFGKDHERRQRIDHPWQLSQNQRWRSSKIFSRYDTHGKYYNWLSDGPLHYDFDLEMNPVLSSFETDTDARQRIPQTVVEIENREYNDGKKITTTAPLKLKKDIDSDITASNFLLKEDSSSELPTVKVRDSTHSDIRSNSMVYIPEATQDNSENPVTQNVEGNVDSKVSYVLNAESNSHVSETSSTGKESFSTRRIMENITSPEINSYNSVSPITIFEVGKTRDSSPTSNPGSSSSDEKEMHSASSIASTTERTFSDGEEMRSITTTTSNTESTSSNVEEMQSTTITASESTSSDGEEMKSTTTTAANSESTSSDGEEMQSITTTASNSESTSSHGKEMQLTTTTTSTKESTTLNPISSTIDKYYSVSTPEKEFTDGNIAISSNSGFTESSKSEYVTKAISEDHVIRISSIKTARMILTVVFLVIALVAVAILAVYIFRARRKAAHYDQLLLLP